MPASNYDRPAVLAGIISVGLVVCGLLIGNGFAQGRAGERFVTVKGVSEREVKADLAIWPLHIVAADNVLESASAKLTSNIEGVRRFLAKYGLDTTQIQLTGYSVHDDQAREYGSGVKAANRYLIRQTLLIRSTQPDKVLTASQRVSELAAVGVAVSSGGNEDGPGGSGPSFVFSGLNALKPAMIADATARARESAEQFARDSHSSLGAIRQANQGVFEILPRDQAQGITEESQIAKIVRVVSTIEYFLK
jgi:hypothetical protein